MTGRSDHYDIEESETMKVSKQQNRFPIEERLDQCLRKLAHFLSAVSNNLMQSSYKIQIDLMPS